MERNMIRIKLFRLLFSKLKDTNITIRVILNKKIELRVGLQ